MIVILIATNLDFGAMKKYELRHQSEMKEAAVPAEQEQQRRGRVLDLIIPIAVLIILCISAMLYTGGILDGVSVKDAFANCDSSRDGVIVVGKHGAEKGIHARIENDVGFTEGFLFVHNLRNK